MSLKYTLLFELESHRDKSLSGQKLAEKFGVSRNAVWKAVNSLKQDGYIILSCTNKGYRLADGNDLLSAEGIQKYLSREAKPLPVFYYPEIDSTNDEAKRKLANGLNGAALIVSGFQSAGRGRNGHTFYSPKTGAYMTLVLHPEASISDTVRLTSIAAVAVVEAVEALTDKRPMIKWVNDIVLDDKKIAGILTEAITDFETGTVQNVIIGIGINMKGTDFPEELRNIAASLESAGVTRNQIVAEIANRLWHLSKNLSDRSYLDEYRKHSMVLGRKIRYRRNEAVFRATAVGIDDSGGLIVQNEDGSRLVLHSGEISIRLDRK